MILKGHNFLQVKSGKIKQFTLSQFECTKAITYYHLNLKRLNALCDYNVNVEKQTLFQT